MSYYEDMETTIAHMKERLLNITGSEPTGNLETIITVFASRLVEFTDKLKTMNKQMFVDTADEEHLILLAGKLLERDKGTKARGIINVYGYDYAGRKGEIPPFTTGDKFYHDGKTYIVTDRGILRNTDGHGYTVKPQKIINEEYVFPQLSTFSDDKSFYLCKGDTVFSLSSNPVKIQNATLEYFTIATADVKNRERGIYFSTANIHTIVLEVEAEAVGSAFNVTEFGAEMTGTKTEIENVRAVSITGGEEQETLQAFRQRVRSFIGTPKPPFSQAYIKSYIMEKFGQKYENCFIITGTGDDAGKVLIYMVRKTIAVTSKAHELDDVEKNEILQLVQNIKPIDILKSHIVITGVAVKTVEITIQGLSPNIGELKNDIEKNLNTTLGKARFNQEITKQEIELVISRTVTESGLKAEKFTVETKDIKPHVGITLLSGITWS